MSPPRQSRLAVGQAAGDACATASPSARGSEAPRSRAEANASGPQSARARSSVVSCSWRSNGLNSAPISTSRAPATPCSVAARSPSPATLHGVAGALLAEMGAEFKPFERQLHETTEERALALCGSDAFASARERGASLPLAEGLAVAHASPAA